MLRSSRRIHDLDSNIGFVDVMEGFISHLKSLIQEVRMPDSRKLVNTNNNNTQMHFFVDVFNITANSNIKYNYDWDYSSEFFISENRIRNTIIVILYSIIFLISILGNGLVCRVVRLKKTRTLTVILITNLSLSDSLMTFFNIPLHLSRIVLDNWLFGNTLCVVLPFLQVLFVYVSTFTMLYIAVDRYRVVCDPFSPRIKPKPSSCLILIIIWLSSAFLSIPHALYNKVVEVITYHKILRCQVIYPEPAKDYRKWITLMTFLTQYVLPLLVTGTAYYHIIRRIWYRRALGVVTPGQQLCQTRTKKKTVKMLVLVVTVFTICWLPLNLYNIITDFNPSESPTKRDFILYLCCHWLAMSSVCCNPFIYCWLNDNFRMLAYSWLNNCRMLWNSQSIHKWRADTLYRFTASRLKFGGTVKSFRANSSLKTQEIQFGECLTPCRRTKTSLIVSHLENSKLFRRWWSLMDLDDGKGELPPRSFSEEYLKN